MTPKPLGRKVKMEDKKENMEKAAEALLARLPHVYVAFTYLLEDGTVGFGNVILNLYDLRTRAHIETAVVLIKQQHPEYTDITVLNWKPLES